MHCSVCNQKNIGCCVQCSRKQCQSSFHVECARLAGLAMEVGSPQMSKDVLNFLYCEKHRPLKIKKALETSIAKYISEVNTFYKTIERCKLRVNTVGNKKKGKKGRDFTEKEKKVLVARIKYVIKKYPYIRPILEQNDKGEYSKVTIPEYLTPSNIEQLDKKNFPWHFITVGAHSSRECYIKYKQIVDSQTKFEALLYSSVSEKTKRKVDNFNKNSAGYVPYNYCICKKSKADQMIECSGLNDCIGHNWYHSSCIKISKEQFDLLKSDENEKYYCPDCTRRINENEEEKMEPMKKMHKKLQTLSSLRKASSHSCPL